MGHQAQSKGRAGTLGKAGTRKGCGWGDGSVFSVKVTRILVPGMHSCIMSLLVWVYSGSRGKEKLSAHLCAVLKTRSTTQTTTGFGSTVSKFALPARSWELLENVNIFYRYKREACTKAYFLGGMRSWKSNPSPQSWLGKAPWWRREGFRCWPSSTVKRVQKLDHYLSSLKIKFKKEQNNPKYNYVV